MLEVTQTTIIATVEHKDDDDDGDFLDLAAFAAGASFDEPSYHYPCHEEEEETNEEMPLHVSWRRPPYERHDSWGTSTSASSDDDEESTCCSKLLERRVRFASVNQILHYDKPAPNDWNQLYYSCHELQRIVDEYRLEQQEEQEWEEECSLLAASKQGEPSGSLETSDTLVNEKETPQEEQSSATKLSGARKNGVSDTVKGAVGEGERMGAVPFAPPLATAVV